MTRVLSNIFFGIKCLKDGYRILKEKPNLWLGIFVPWVLNFSILFFGWSSGLGWIKTSLLAYIAKFVGTEGIWFNLLYYPILVIFALGFMATTLFFALSISTLIAAPFYSWLAEATLQHRGETLPNLRGFNSRIRFFSKMLVVGLAKAIVFAAMGLTLFVLSFIPIVNIFAAYFTMCLLAADTFDYALEAKGFNFSQRLKNFSNNFGEIAGLGIFLTLTSLVPGLTVLLLPLFVIGAAVHLAPSRSMK